MRSPRKKRYGKNNKSLTTLQREDAEICRLDNEGYFQSQIAQMTGKSQPYVSKVLKRYRQQCVKESLGNQTERLWELDRYARFGMQENMQAWRESQEQAKKRVEESQPIEDCPACDGTKLNAKGLTCRICSGRGTIGGIVKTVDTTEEQVGDPRFLKQFMDCVEFLRRLYGVGQEAATINDVKVYNYDWNNITRHISAMGLMKGEVEEKLQAKIDEARKLIPSTTVIIPPTTNGNGAH